MSVGEVFALTFAVPMRKVDSNGCKDSCDYAKENLNEGVVVHLSLCERTMLLAADVFDWSEVEILWGELWRLKKPKVSTLEREGKG